MPECDDCGLPSSKRSELRRVPLDLIDPPRKPLRVSIDEDELIGLAESIRSVGLLSPLVVAPRGDRYEVRAGHRRFLALRWLGWPDCDCYLVAQGEGPTDTAGAAENLVRSQLNPVEEAHEVRRLTAERGLTARQVSRAVGRSEAWVRGRLDMLHWPEELLIAVGSGQLAVSAAREIVLVEDENVRAHYLASAVESGATAEVCRRWRQDWEAVGPGDGSGAASHPAGVAPGVRFVPRQPCGVCDGQRAVTELAFVRVCPGCLAALEESKREPQAPNGTAAP